MDTTRIIFVILYMVTCIQCRPNGPPVGDHPDICVSMNPTGHYGLKAQTGDSPFSITIGATTYTPGTPVSVTIGGSVDFKGIFLQARKVNKDEIVGKFSSPPDNTKLMKCGEMNDNVVGHSNRNPKNNLVFTWNPPPQDAGEVEFVATIVQATLTVWVKQTSTTKLTFEGNEATTDSSSMGSNEETEGPDGENPDGENPDGGKKPGKNGVPLAGVSVAAVAFTILAAVAVALF